MLQKLKLAIGHLAFGFKPKLVHHPRVKRNPTVRLCRFTPSLLFVRNRAFLSHYLRCIENVERLRSALVNFILWRNELAYLSISIVLSVDVGTLSNDFAVCSSIVTHVGACPGFEETALSKFGKVPLPV